MFASKLINVSTRGRVAYAICYLENALTFYNYRGSEWDFILRQLWFFCNDNMAIWQERISELTPFVILDKVDFRVKDYKYLNEDQHNSFNELYAHTNKVVLRILDLVYEIGITNLYVKINNENLKIATLPYIQEVIDLMQENKIPLPDIALFDKLDISENYGWGREFTREEIFNERNS